MKITYYLRSSKIDKNGNSPIYAKIYTLNGEINKSSGVRCKTDEWNKEKQSITDTFLNQKLTKFKKITKKESEQLSTEKPKKSKEALDKALDKFEFWNFLKIKAPSTKKGDKNRLLFLRLFFNDSDVYFSPKDIDNTIANRYINFLKAKYNYSNSTLNRHNKFLKTFVKYCVNENILSKNPVEIVAKPQKPKQIQHLTSKEVEQIRNIDLPYRLEKVRDLFMFAINTGLAFVDLVKIDRKYIFMNEKGVKYIRISRNKTETECIIPLNAEANNLLDKYNYVLPTLSYDKYNKYLKEVGELASVETKITTHTARRTCGMILLNNNLSYDMVAKILGHANIQTTKDYYARYLNDTILDTYFRLMG